VRIEYKTIPGISGAIRQLCNCALSVADLVVFSKINDIFSGSSRGRESLAVQ